MASRKGPQERPTGGPSMGPHERSRGRPPEGGRLEGIPCRGAVELVTCMRIPWRGTLEGVRWWTILGVPWKISARGVSM